MGSRVTRLKRLARVVGVIHAEDRRAVRDAEARYGALAASAAETEAVTGADAFAGKFFPDLGVRRLSAVRAQAKHAEANVRDAQDAAVLSNAVMKNVAVQLETEIAQRDKHEAAQTLSGIIERVVAENGKLGTSR